MSGIRGPKVAVKYKKKAKGRKTDTHGIGAKDQRLERSTFPKALDAHRKNGIENQCQAMKEEPETKRGKHTCC